MEAVLSAQNGFVKPLNGLTKANGLTKVLVATKRDVLVEHQRPDLAELLARLPSDCDPYFACMVVSCRTRNGVVSSSHRQRTNIYIARSPYDMIERLNSGVPLNDRDALDLSPSISKLLPQQASSRSVVVAAAGEQEYEADDEEHIKRKKQKTKLKKAKKKTAAAEEDESRHSSVAMIEMLPEEEEAEIVIKEDIIVLPMPPPPVTTTTTTTTTSIVFHPMLLAKTAPRLGCASSCMFTIHEEWIERAVVAVRAEDAVALSKAIERGELAIEPAIERIENLRRALLNDKTSAAAAATEVFAAATTTTAPEALLPPPPLPAQQFVVAHTPTQRRSESERKRRRRQMNKKAAAVKPAAPLPPPPPPSPRPAVKKPPKSAVAKAAATIAATKRQETKRPRETTQKIGMILGPIFTRDTAKLVGVVWGLKSRGSIPRSALGERLAERFSLNLYADLTVIFEGEDLDRHLLKQTDTGELWLVLKNRAEILDRVLNGDPMNE